AFNHSNSGSVSFHEFLIGLAFMEPGSQPGELRAAFLFRYYDLDEDGYLNAQEMSLMMADLNPKADKKQVAAKVSSALSEISTKTVHSKSVLSLEDFRQAIVSRKLSGTSALCRSSKSIITQISKAIADRTAVHGATSLSGIVY